MNKITYTTIKHDLCEPIAELIKICFPLMPLEDQYSHEELLEVCDVFPEGTIVALDGERPIGMGTGIFADVDFENLPPTEKEFLYSNKTLNHNPNGAYYYGSDMMVHPEYRKRGIGRQIYNRRKGLVRDQNKRGFAAAAVLPGYANFKNKVDIYTYLEMVVDGEVFDPTLSMQMRNGFKLVRPIKDFFVYPRSNNWAALIVWENPAFQRKRVKSR